jgi:hypothetical protein
MFRGKLVAAAIMSCAELSPLCTVSPDASVKNVAAAAQRSVRASISLDFARACSGAMNAGVPRSTPVAVDVASFSLARPSRTRAMPKSSTFTTPPFVRNTLLGLRSR